MLRAPGELGLGRAYVTGAIDVDDLDAVVKVVDTWQPPPIDRRTKAKLALAALRATGVVRPPGPAVVRAPAARGASTRSRATRAPSATTTTSRPSSSASSSARR